MATLKEIRLRLKSVQNIQKITKSMKMVSAAKYARAERDLRSARSYGIGADAFFEKIAPEEKETEGKKSQVFIAMTSDRGLCGGVHSNVCRAIKAKMNAKESGVETKLILIGDKARNILQRLYGKDIILAFSNIGKAPPNFNDASFLAEQISNSGYKFDSASLFFNKFRNVVSYNTSNMTLYTEEVVAASPKLSEYDSVDEEVLKCYNEYMLASRIYYALKEAACSEQSSRMTAMDSASKNAEEMIAKLTLTFNRTRQAVITRELIEIISGANAL